MDCNSPWPLFMEFSRQEYWSGLLFPTPGDLPDQGIKPESPALADGFFTTSATWEALYDPAILLLDNFTQEKWKHAHTNTCTQIFHTCIPNSQTQKQSNKGTLHGNKKKKREQLMHVTPRMHLNCANERNQTQKATYYMISCQWISGSSTTVGTEMYPWLPGYRSGGRSLMANSARENLWTIRHFLHFYCGTIYTTVYICQKSTNGNMLKCWLLLYINYTSILFLKEKEILSI